MKVRFYGHVGQLSGYGRAASDLCMSLLAAGAELEIRPLGKVHAQEAGLALERYEPLKACLRHDHDLSVADAMIVHTLPGDCRRVVDLELSRDPSIDPNIPWVAYTTWEGLSAAPDAIIGPLVDFEALWVPSTATARAMMGWKTHEADHLHVVPHAFDPDSLQARRTRRADPAKFSFFYVGAWNSRKNPSGLLRAWAMAFTPADNVELFVHSPGASHEGFAIAMSQTGVSPLEMASVVFDPVPRTDDAMIQFYAESDCFVTASRGEAWNLPAFEAMLAGRHVIAPSPMGSDDFLRDTSADLYGGMAMPASVDVRVTERMPDGKGVQMQVIGAQGLSSRSTWLEPDLVRLAEAMRNAYLAQRRDLTINYDPAERYGYPAVGQLAMAALDNLI